MLLTAPKMLLKLKMRAIGNFSPSEEKYLRFLPFAILLISLSSVLQWLNLPLSNTFLWWFLDAFVLFCFYHLYPPKSQYVVKLIDYWIILLILNALYGVLFMAENYWDYKNLVRNIFVFSMPAAALVFYKPERLKLVLSYWLKYAWILFLVIAPFLTSDGFPRFLVPYSFLALFYPFLKIHLKIAVLVAFAITILLGYDDRADILKFSFCLFLGCVVNRKHLMGSSPLMLTSLRSWGMVIPFVFVALGTIGSFNLFHIQEELGLEEENYKYVTVFGDENSMLADSRTFLYNEAITSAIDNNYVIQGRSIARGYDQTFFSWMIEAQLKGLHGDFRTNERPSTEVSILNILTYFGIIGVFLYMWIFAEASRKAIFSSKNNAIKIVGIYIVFRWIFAFVEDFSRFDLNMLFLWIMIGMCFSPYWRAMSNDEFKQWIRRL